MQAGGHKNLASKPDLPTCLGLQAQTAAGSLSVWCRSALGFYLCDLLPGGEELLAFLDAGLSITKGNQMGGGPSGCMEPCLSCTGASQS